MKLAARLLLLALAVATLVELAASPASAHSLIGQQGTNYETEIIGITPPIPGIHAKVIDLGNRVELRDDSRHVVVVFGYQHDPYLRIGPDGAYRNDRSPATFLNQSTAIPGPVPDSYQATAPPRWSRIGDTVVRWHDHRTHWMGSSDPPVVQHDPSHRHVVISHWKVPLTIDGRPAMLTGNVVWVPGPSPWPWVVLALVLVAAVVILARLAHDQWFAGAFALGIAIAAVLALGSWRYSTASAPARFIDVIYDVGTTAVLVVVLALLAHRPDLRRWSPGVLLAGLVLAFGTGLARVTMLFRSQLPTTLTPGLARALVATAIGIGLGMVTVGILRLRPPKPTARPRPPRLRQPEPA
jgi:hypothetical protein